MLLGLELPRHLDDGADRVQGEMQRGSESPPEGHLSNRRETHRMARLGFSRAAIQLSRMIQ